MKKYTFDQLEKGKLYFEENPGDCLMFVGMRNYQIATFKYCEYDEDKDDWIPTEREVYLTKNELKFEF